ncbi:MAG TPA: PAS domain-containing protein [Anaerolineae bacterium]|nr:PAS domain-containing protein [Anaerolineae bacterium]
MPRVHGMMKDKKPGQPAHTDQAYAELEVLAEELRAQNQELLAVREALEVERRRYRDLFDLAPDGYLITDRCGTIEEANRAAAELLGVEACALAGQPLTVYVDYGDVPTMFRHLRRLADGQEELLSWEVRLYPPDGEEIDVAVKVTRSGNGHGEPPRFRWLVRDVTERKKAEREREQLLAQVAGDRDIVEELARSLVQERDVLQTIMENTRTCLAYLDRDLNVQRMNLACVQAWACTGRDLVDCSPFRLHPEEENEVLLARVLETGEPISFRAEPQALRTGVNGETTYWDWRLVPVKDADGQVQGVVLSMQDVTVDVRAAWERELLLEGNRQQREFLEELIETAPLAIGVVRGREHRFELANSYFLDLPGDPTKPMLARPVAEVFPEATARGVGAVLDEVYRTGEAVSLRQFETGVGPGREQTFWDADYIPLRDPEGEVDGVLIVGHDVTEEVVTRRRIEALAARDEAILENMTEGLVVFDMDGNVLAMNAAALRLHEFEHVEDVRRHLDEYAPLFDLYDLEGRPIPVDDWPLARVVRGESFVDCEVQVVNRHGGRRWIGSYSGTPVRHRDGDIILGVVTTRDVTAQKEAEAERERLLEENRDQREFLERLLQSAPVGIGAIRTADYVFELANSEHYPPPWMPGVQIVGGTLAEVFPDLAVDVRRAVDLAARTGRPLQVREYEAPVAPEGEPTYWNADYVPLVEPDGTIERVLIVVEEVTDQVQARRRIEALAAQARQQAEELNAVFEAMAEAVMVYDALGTMVFANTAARGIHGIDLVGAARPDVIRLLAVRFPDGRPATVEDLPVNRALQGETVTGERLVFVDGQGRKHAVLASAAPMVIDGTPQGAVAVWHDVTEREEALGQLAEERARLKAIVDNAPEGIVLADSEARVVLSNPAAERMFVRSVPYGEEYDAQARMQIHHPDGTPWQPRDLPLTRSAMDGETLSDVEQIIVWPDGQQRRLLVNTVPIRDEEGRVTGAVGVFQDVTDQVAARETLRRQNDELRVLTEELEAYDHTVAHDLKNPLTMVTGSADLLNEALRDEDAPGPQRMLRNILEGTRRMNDIVESLLLLTSTRRHEVELVELDMAQIVIDACDTLASTIERREATLRVAADWPVASGFAPWVESVWTNYLSNALKYGGEPPHIELGWAALCDDSAPAAPDTPALAEGDLTCIRSKVENPDSKIVFWVRDHGPGLAEEARARLFVEFTRLDRPHKLGHGLGLAIVRRVVEALGGEVGVESRAGAGCTFWFTLPAER